MFAVISGIGGTLLRRSHVSAGGNNAATTRFALLQNLHLYFKFVKLSRKIKDIIIEIMLLPLGKMAH